ncbi:hypothetical protein NL676_005169 [Syzygium grande]|nr:hypothetical protein NL676_005169 [Syzygium grande]
MPGDTKDLTKVLSWEEITQAIHTNLDTNVNLSEDKLVELENLVQNCRKVKSSSKHRQNLREVPPPIISNKWLELDTESKFKNPLLRNLQLSHHDKRSSQLKLCLLSFAIFPESSIIKKRSLIYWWIGQGLVSQSKDKMAEQVGDEVYDELLKQGLIEPDDNDPSPLMNRCSSNVLFKQQLPTLNSSISLLSNHLLGSHFSGTAIKSAINPSFPQQLEKLELIGIPVERIPKWLNPRELKNMKKLYIIGGKLESWDHQQQNEQWSVEILRLKHLKKLSIENKEDVLKKFPRLGYFERINCADNDILWYKSRITGRQVIIHITYRETHVKNRGKSGQARGIPGQLLAETFTTKHSLSALQPTSSRRIELLSFIDKQCCGLCPDKSALPLLLLLPSTCPSTSLFPIAVRPESSCIVSRAATPPLPMSHQATLAFPFYCKLLCREDHLNDDTPPLSSASSVSPRPHGVTSTVPVAYRQLGIIHAETAPLASHHRVTTKAIFAVRQPHL